MKRILSILFISLLLISCGAKEVEVYNVKDLENLEMATFAGGCFWCMEHPFEKLDGVYTVVSGFSGGSEKNPVYADVARGLTGHRESVQIQFDPTMVSYSDLLNVFWRQIDPIDSEGQFVDRGKHYTAAIFFHDNNQKELALASKVLMDESCSFDKPIVTDIIPYTSFYPAEDYHQDFYKEHSLKYSFYRKGSGRDKVLDKIWKGNTPICRMSDKSSVNGAFNKPGDDELRRMLTPLQYKVTQQDGTEKPFDNPYNDNKKPGIYVDIVSGEALFSSKDKYDSKTGWPSFTKPLVAENIIEKEESKLFIKRTELRSAQADSHLGHVFPDGPEPLGLRYCINSAALRFVPVEEMKEQGYEEFLDDLGL